MQLSRILDKPFLILLRWTFVNQSIYISIALKIFLVKLLYKLGYRTKTIKNYAFLFDNKIDSELGSYLFSLKMENRSFSRRCIVVGPLTSYNEAIMLSLDLDAFDVIAFLKPRGWDLQSDAKKICFLNSWAATVQKSHFTELITSEYLVYVRPGDSFACEAEVRTSAEIPSGFGASALALNRAICTLLRDFRDYEIFISGINFHLEKKLYSEDYKTHLRDADVVVTSKLRESLAIHDWLFNFLVTKKLVEIGRVKFDKNSEAFLSMETSDAIRLLDYLHSNR